MQLQQLILFHLGDSLSGQLHLVDDQTPRLRRGAPLVEKHEERISVDGTLLRYSDATTAG